MLPEVQAVSYVHRYEPIRLDGPHRAEDVRLLRPEGLASAGHEFRGVDEVLETSWVHVHLGPRHFREQKSGSAGVVQMDMGNDECVDVRRPQSKRADGFQDA